MKVVYICMQPCMNEWSLNEALFNLGIDEVH